MDVIAKFSMSIQHFTTNIPPGMNGIDPAAMARIQAAIDTEVTAGNLVVAVSHDSSSPNGHTEASAYAAPQ